MRKFWKLSWKEGLVALALFGLVGYLFAMSPWGGPLATRSKKGVAGTALNGVGGAISNATIVIQNQRGAIVEEVNTDSSGHFDVRGLQNGTYRIHAIKSGYAPTNQTVMVKDEAEPIWLVMRSVSQLASSGHPGT